MPKKRMNEKDPPIELSIVDETKKPSVAQLPRIEVIEEADEEDGSKKQTKPARQYVRSQTSTNSSRESVYKKSSQNNNVEGNGVPVQENGYDNEAFQYHSSTLRDSSRSLPVIREQYCCCVRWTKLERRLLKAVGICALIIIALAITVGILASKQQEGVTSQQRKFLWSI